VKRIACDSVGDQRRKAVQIVTSCPGYIRRTAAALPGAAFWRAPAHGADIEPRAYSNAPVGMNFLIVGYAYSDGGLSTDPASPLQDARLKISTGLLAYARTLNLWGKSGKIDIVMPYSDLSGTATFKGEPAERQVTGFTTRLQLR
jgi:hypothetical protein